MKFIEFVFLLSFVCIVAGSKLAGATFEFTDQSELDRVTGGELPVEMTREGITLSALSISGPSAFGDDPAELEPAKAINTTFSGLGIDSPSIANAELAEMWGDDAGSETNTLNILETITVRWDHSVIISALRFRDLEAGEKIILTTESGLEQELQGSTAWSAGNGSFVTFNGSELGALEGYLLQRHEPLTVQFDTVDPLDRVPDGNGNQWDASPSTAWTSVTVEVPETYGMGTPYSLEGGPSEATVGCELWGSDADVTLRWSQNPESGWENSTGLGNQSPGQLEGILEGISPDTVWYYQFVADNGTETVTSPVSEFTWGTRFFVSPGGDNDNDGLSAESPLQTIEAALNKIRDMNRKPQPEGPQIPNYLTSASSPYRNDLKDHLANLVDSVEIVLLPGFHFLEDSIEIEKALDGNLHFVGQWSNGAVADLEALLSQHGEEENWFDLPTDKIPVVSGGIELTGWTETNLNGKTVWELAVSEIASGDWEFKQLFVDGMRAQRSRWPKEGWFRMEEIDNETRLDFRIEATDLEGIEIENWPDLNNVEAVMLHYWVDDRNKIESFDPESRWMSLFPPKPEYPLFGSHPLHEAGNAAYYFDNVFATLSEPGEFYVNYTSGRVYYLPKEGQTPEETTVIAPRLKELFEIRGKPAGPEASMVNERLWNVTFKNIGFMHTRTGLLAIHDGTGNNATNSDNAAIRYEYARKGAIEGCFFGHLGEYAIELGYETTGFDIAANMFRSLSGGAIKAYQQINPEHFEHRTGWHHLHDNDIYDFAKFWHGSPAILATANAFIRVEHNYIRNGYFNGVNVSGVGNNLLRFGHSNLIRKNHIHDIGQGILSDLAGIYAPNQNPHGLIEGNIVHDIEARDYTSPAVYLDGSAEYWTVRGNWLYRSNTKLLNMKGWTHDLRDNVLAYSANKNLDRRNGDLESHQSTEFPLIEREPPNIENNIFIPLSGVVYSNEFYTDAITPWAHSDRNVMWNHGMELWAGQPELGLEAFQSATGQDSNSVIAEPGFAAPLRGDFRIDNLASELNTLGITSIDNTDAGIRNSVWVDLGMPEYTIADTLVEDWIPSDVPGMVGWLDAANLESGKALAEWKNAFPYSYTMQQFDRAFQPEVRNDEQIQFPVVHFNGNSWMANDEFGMEAKKNVGRFAERDFAIYAVYQSDEDGVFLSKGSGGSGGNWSVGETANAFQWGGDRSIGDQNGEWAVRSWHRRNGNVEFYRNGELIDTVEIESSYDFNTEDFLYLGKRSNSTENQFSGDIGEILIYIDANREEDVGKIHDYLLSKWMAEFPGITGIESYVESRESAEVSAEITTGGALSNVDLFYGIQDGGKTSENWEYSKSVSLSSDGSVGFDLSELTPGMTYYFRLKVSNSRGSVWSSETGSFKTEITIFKKERIIENQGAEGNEYQRSLAYHISSEYQSSEISFTKISGPEWLNVDDDGTLNGQPDSNDRGLNEFMVNAKLPNGDTETIELQIKVEPPDLESPSLPEAVSIAVVNGQIQLEWEENNEIDFSHYIILKSNDLSDGFTKTSDVLWQPEFSEPHNAASPMFYKIDSVDSSGNRGSGDK